MSISCFRDFMSGSYFTRYQKSPSILADNRLGISLGFIRIIARVKWIQTRSLLLALSAFDWHASMSAFGGKADCGANVRL
jgi:hypothetical protein